MKRIKSNIIELGKLYATPCGEWLERFENGRIDAHEAFKKYGEKYYWLYNYSPYDLIGWQIENGVFDWGNNSNYVAEHCPEKIDPVRFNWKDHTWAVKEYCPEKLDLMPEKYRLNTTKN